MPRLGSLVPLLLVAAGCARAERATDSACARASTARLRAESELREGALQRAREEFALADGLCPEGGHDTAGDEVKLLAELGRCDEAETLTRAIDAEPDRSGGAWLSAAVARAECERERTAPTTVEALLTEGEMREGAGDDVGARRSWDRALARAKADKLAIVATCTHWSHRGRSVGPWVPVRDALTILEGDHALVLAASDGHELAYLGHGSTIATAIASDDGQLVATAGDDVVLWSLDRVTPLARFAGHAPLAFSHQDQRLAWASTPRELSIAVPSGGTPLRIALTAEPIGVGFVSDGAVVVSLADETLRTFDVASGKELAKQAHAPVRVVVALGPKRLLLAKLGGPAVVGRGVELVAGETKRELAPPTDEVDEVAADGSSFITRRGLYTADGGDLVVEDTASGRATPLPFVLGENLGLANGGRRVFYLDDDDALREYDVESGVERTIRTSASGKIEEFSVSRDGSGLLVSFAGGRGAPGASFTWTDAGPTRLGQTRGRPVMVDPRFATSAFTVDGQTWLELFDARTGAYLTDVKLPYYPSLPVFSPSGRFFVVDARDRIRGVVPQRFDLERVAEPASVPGFKAFDDDDALVTEQEHDYEFLEPLRLSVRRRRPIGEAPIFDDAAICHPGRTRRCFDTEHVTVGDVDRTHFVYRDAEDHTLVVQAYDHQIASSAAPASGNYLAVAYQEGTILFSRPDATHGLELHPLRYELGGWVTTNDGHLELFGDAEARAVCRIGARSLPIRVCAELVQDGALAAYLHAPPLVARGDSP